MTGPEKKSNWRALIESLGVAPPAESEDLQEPILPPAATSSTPATPSQRRKQHTLAPKSDARPKNHWGMLAGQLGLTPLPEPEPEPEPPPAPAPAPTPSVVAETTAEPPATERETYPPPTERDYFAVAAADADSDVEPIVADRRRGPASRAFSDEPESFAEIAEEAEQMAEEEEDDDEFPTASEPPADLFAPVAAEPIEGEAPTRKRRRRRRRRKSGAGRETTPSDEAGDRDVAGVAEDDEDSPDLRGSDTDADEEDDDSATESRAEEEGEERPARRRRRRRRRRSKPEAESTATSGKAKRAESDAEDDFDDEEEDDDGRTYPVAAPTTARNHASAEDDEDDEDDDFDAAEHAKSRKGHIPTWEEAIGVIVTANIESRSRSPGGERGRGRRGRGGGGRRGNG